MDLILLDSVLKVNNVNVKKDYRLKWLGFVLIIFEIQKFRHLILLILLEKLK